MAIIREMRRGQKQPRIDPDAQRVRQKFLSALEAGMSSADATRVANLGAPRALANIPPPPKKVIDAAKSPLDHDGDGKPGGSTAPAQTDDLAALRSEYREVVGKKAFPGWDSATLKQKIAAARG